MNRFSVVARWSVTLGALAVVALARCVVDPSPDAVWSWPSPQIVDLRMGAILSGAAAGACLGLSGVLLQALLRNPLASPFVLGLSSGAGLGVSLAALGSAWGVWWLMGDSGIVAASAGAGVALGVVLVTGRRRGVIDPVTLLLSGVVVGSTAGALTVLVQYLMPPSSRLDAMMWTLGRIPELPDRVVLGSCVTALAVSVPWTIARSRVIDACSTSDEEARSLGVDLSRMRILLLVCAGVLAGCSVVLCGPLAFVGFVAPHVARIVHGARHRPLVLAAPVLGAALVIGADAVRQSLPLPGAGRLPIGVLTALLGGPLFLVVLHRGGRRVA